MQDISEIIIEKVGGRYSRELGIKFERGEKEIFKWFVASVLFGARIGEGIAKRTYKEFEKEGLVTPHKISKAGWDKLVEVLDRGGYVRYDFKTADKFLEFSRKLLKNYKGKLSEIHRISKDGVELEKRLKELAKGIGDTTVNIFLRELRETWEKANPSPSPFTKKAAINLGFCKEEDDSKDVLLKLKKIFKTTKDFCFTDFETALLRFYKRYCKKGLCSQCNLKRFCKKAKSYSVD